MEPVPSPTLDPPGAWRQRARALLGAARDYAWDNPTAEHDERSILVGPKVGLWLALLLLMVLAGAAFAFLALPAAVPALRTALAELGPGPYLISATQASLALFLTLIMPLRSVGLLEGPRWRGYLDQLVTTGITPWRYFAGKWATTQPFLLAILVATFPLTLLFALLGGFDPLRALIGYALLYAYGNLLLAVSLALGVAVHDLAALLLTWGLFAGLSVLDYCPVPATLAAWTPHRFFVLPFVSHLAGSEADTMLALLGRAHPLGLDLPWLPWALFVWLVVGVIAVLGCAIGPLHVFQPGLNNFGSVVLPGDRSRRILRRVRPLLQRRVELAFLFENRGPRLVRWTLALRGLQILLLLALLAVILPAAALDPALIGTLVRHGDELEAWHGAANGLVLLLLLVTLICGRREEQLALPVGRHRVPLLVLDLSVFVAICALLLAAHALAHARAWEALQSLTAGGAGLPGVTSPSDLWARGAATLAVLITTTTSAFLVSRTVGGRAAGQGALTLITVLYLLVLVLGPMFAIGASSALAQADEDVPREALALVRPLWVVGQVSPITPLVLTWESRLPHWLDGPQQGEWLLWNAFWVWHPLLLALLVPRFVARVLGTRDAALALEHRRRGLPPALPCVRCPTGEAARLRWSWWGGWIGPRLLGYVHCQECGTIWSTRPGSWRGPAAVFLLRLAVAAVVAITIGAVLLGRLWGLG